ncbi:Translation initiation factor eIF2B subunit delta [Caenorhabditis elegans]|nr:Translation initiation factor eIF-2B subunit delta [Caenorhabditis elegans]CAI91168.1 Translation initiation factor eIF-2B subunit delta [Caenorhabditis elegans]|eukprot:NP_001023785.1 Eukaryotic Initiation Factor [Caenorhabditis elegans]
MILGVKSENNQQVVPPTTAEEPAQGEDKNQYHKDVTAEDKKARKAAKAAEKKARAEKSVANKAAAAAGSTQNQGQKKEKPPKEHSAVPSESTTKLIEENAQLTKTTEQLAAKMETLVIEDVKINGSLKPAIKKSTGVEKNVRHVHNVIMPSVVTFDLPKNQTKTLPSASDSDEAVASEIESTAIAQLDDATSFVHIHPAFLTLMAKAELEKIPDVETVCIQFIAAFKEFLRDWTVEREKNNINASTFGHDLDLAIRPQLAHMTQNGHWPLPFALGNTVRLLKRTIKRLEESTNMKCEEELQVYLEDTLAINFCHAYKAISQLLVRKIQQFKKVVVFDWCPVVNHVLLEAKQQIPDMQLSVIDANSNGRGTRHVKSFVDQGYNVKYVTMKGASWASLASGVLILGCSAIFANGAVAARKGALAVVLCANHYNIPVIVVAEHFKFIDKGQVYQRVALLGRQNIECIQSDLVTAVVTDLRILGPTSAPAVLKAKALTDMA